MAVGPSVPHKLDGVAGVSVGIQAASRGALVAVYVYGSGGGRLDKAQVLVQRVPTGRLGTAFLGQVVPHGVGAFGRGSGNVDVGDEAVGGDGVEEEGGGAEKEGRGVHVGRSGENWCLVVVIVVCTDDSFTAASATSYMFTDVVRQRLKSSRLSQTNAERLS